MKTEIYTNIESEILNIVSINETPIIFDDILAKSELGEHTILSVLTNLVSKGILKFDDNKYSYQVSPTNKKLILNGNLLLPVTIIRKDGYTYVCRGKWYKFKGEDFDIKRIIWNTIMNLSGEKSTLVELIEQQLLSTPNIKVSQLPEYKQLQNKKIVYNDKMDILIKVVGKDHTKVSICFKEKIHEESNGIIDKEMYHEFCCVQIPTIISTDSLLGYLKISSTDRKGNEIELPTVFTSSDIIYNGNTIPVIYDKKSLTYYHIEKTKQKMILTKRIIGSNGEEIDIDSSTYDNLDFGIEFLNGSLDYCRNMMIKCGIILEE